MTDRELLDRYRGGDISAFDALMARFEGPLLRFVSRYRAHAAQDLVQEVFLRLIRESDSGGLAEVNNLSAWLYRVARNLAIDDARKEERMEARHQFAAAPEAQPASSVSVETKEIAEVVTEKILGLPQKQRDVLVLKLQEERSYKEISAITGLTVSNVGYLIHQGLKGLAGELKRAGVV